MFSQGVIRLRFLVDQGEGSKPSGVSSNRHLGWPKGSSASAQGGYSSMLFVVVIVQIFVIETSGPPGADGQLTLSVGANFATPGW